MLPAVPIYQKASDIQGYAKDATGKCYGNLTMNPNITYVRDATSFYPMKMAGENYVQMVDHIGINLSPDISTVLSNQELIKQSPFSGAFNYHHQP